MTTESFIAVLLGGWAIVFVFRMLRRRGRPTGCSCGKWFNGGDKADSGGSCSRPDDDWDEL